MAPVVSRCATTVSGCPVRSTLPTRHRSDCNWSATSWNNSTAAARRSGVLIVLPLGLCFLPAFVLAGLVPVVVAVLGDVL